MELGTKVRNPVARTGRFGYTKCTFCGLWYTYLGISRHWGKCRKRPSKPCQAT